MFEGFVIVLGDANGARAVTVVPNDPSFAWARRVAQEQARELAAAHPLCRVQVFSIFAAETREVPFQIDHDV